MKSFATPLRRFTQRALLILGLFGMAEMGWGQVTLSGTSYSQNFNGTTLPTGWTTRTSSTSSSLGSNSTPTTADTWASTTAAFRFAASAKSPLTSASNTAAQSAATDRCLAVRPSGSFGDPGQSFNLQLANTTGFTSFSLSFSAQLLDPQGRTSTYQVQYGFGASPTTWTTVGATFTDLGINSGLWGSTTITRSFSNALDNQNGSVWIRIVSLSASSGSNNRCTFGIDDVSLTWSAPATPPTLTAAGSATVDGAFDVTYTDNSAWRAAISSITIGGTTLTAGYSVTAGKITFTPSASVPVGLLQSSGSKAIVVNATGYSTSSVTQALGAGAASKLIVSTQPAAPTANGGALATQPIVVIQDQYSNLTTSTATITATATQGTWTATGTNTKAAVAGSASFSGLTATSAAAVTGATITFTSGALTSVTSGTFNIPAPAPANDLCASANNLVIGASAISGTLAGATYTSNTLTYGPTKNDVWYTFTPTCTGSHSITLTFTSGPDIDIDLFNTSCPTAGTATNISHGNTTTETITASLVSGTVYYIRVIEWSGAAGSFSIGVSGPTPITQSVTSQAASSITTTTATLNGNLTAVGVCPSTIEKGFVYSVTSTNSDPINGGTGVTKTPVSNIVTGAYTLALTGLTTGTGYSFKSYVFDGTNYSYGALTTFTTVLNAPTISTTLAATSITATTASSGGQNITGSLLFAAGVVWDINTAPTVALTTLTNDGTSASNFTSSLSSLSPQTLYYVRAYASNASGTGYGNEVNFRTLSTPVTSQASGFSATATSASNIDLSWTAATFPISGATASGYLLYRSSGSNNPIFASSNGVAPSAGANTTLVATLTVSDISYSNASLTFSTTYNYLLIPFTWDGTNAGTYNYLTASAPAANATTETPSNPVITASGTLSALSTTYGTASSTTTFSVSGVSMQAGILVTSSSGFEVSLSSGSGFASTIVVGTSGTISSTPIYVRLAATTGFGTYSGNITLSSTNANDVTVATVSSNVAKKALTIGVPVIASRVYDGTTNAGDLTIGTLTGFVGSESLTVTGAAANYSSSNVGSYSSTITYTLGDETGLASNYSLANGSATGSITAKALSISNPSIASKVYNGNSASGTVTAGTLSGFVGTETVTASATGAYSDANVGTGKTATIVYTLANGNNGGLAANYSLSNGLATGDIIPKSLSIVAPSIASKVYNGSAAAGTLTVGALSGFVGTQTLLVTGSAADYSGANVGTYYSVVITYTLSNGANGGLVSNYSLANGSATGQITAKSVSISAPSIASKVYDGAATAGTLTIGSLSGTIGGQTLTVSGSAANFSSSNVGSYSSTITYTLGDGTGLASNYSLANGSATGSITAKALSVTTATIVSKAYDGSTASGAVTAGTLSGFVGIQTVVVSSATGLYSDANVGTGKTATITYVLGNGTNGGLAANYSLATTSATGDITQGTTLITFNTLPNKQMGDASFACGASTNFGTLTYSSSNTAVATINSTGIISIVGVGVTTITANVIGDFNYTSTSASQSLTVGVNTYVYRTAASGNWNSTSTWQSSVTESGPWATATVTPGANNSVYILSSHTVTLTQSESCKDLHINTSGIVGIGTNTLSVNGKIRAFTGTVTGTSSTAPVSAMISTSGGGLLKFVGLTRNITNSGEWGATTTGNATEFALSDGETGTLLTSYKSSSISITSGTIDMGTNRLAPDNGTSGQGDLTISSGATLVSSGTGSSSPVISRTGTSTTGRSGIFTLNGTLTLLGAAPQIEFTTVNLNGTVNYGASSIQNLLKSSFNGAASPNTYTNLKLSGTSAKTLGVATTVNGTLTLAGTASLALNSNTLTYGGSSTLEYAGSSAQTTSSAAELSAIPSILKVNNSNGVTLNSNLEVANLDISSSSSLIVPSTKTLTVSGAITNSGTLDIQSGGQLLQGSDTDISGGGQCIYRKDLPLQPNSALAGYNRSYYIGSPVVGSTSTTPVNITSVLGSSTTGLNMYGYTETNNTWPLYYSGSLQSQGSTFDIGKGYYVNSSSGTYFSQANFTGNSFNNGPVTVTLTNTAGQGGGYNLISNPYPSGINWSDIYNDASNISLVSSSYWLRTYQDGAGMTYKTCNASGVSTQGLNTIISPATGFWVKYTGTSPGTFTFKNAMRTSGAGTYYTMNANHIIRLDLGNGSYNDQAVVYMNEDAGLGIESYDSDKRIPSTTVHQLYSLEGTTKLAINGFNNALAKDTVLLGMQIPTAGTYTINASQIDATIEEDVFLEDKITGAYQNLKTTPSYSFTSTQGTFNNRFVLHFAPFVPALPGQTAATAIAMPTSNWPQCNNVTSEDQWHAFTATSEGISIAVNTATTDIVIELQDGTGNVVAQENAVNGIGNETLNIFGLTAGQTYKVGVRNNISSQPTGTYGICVKSLKRGGCDYGAGPYSLCQYYKATWAGSTGVSYTFTFTGTSGPAAGQTFTRTQNSDICVLSTVTPLLPYGSTYDVVISNTYTLTDGAGNTEQITVPSNSACQVITIAEPQTALSNNSSCNNGARFRGAVVSSLPWICGSNNWRWRFTEVNPLTMQEVGLPIELNRGTASNYLSLATVAQLQNGKTYAVQTAPMFSYTGTNYNWGPTQYLCIVGAAQGLLQDAEQGVAQGSTKDALQDASQENDVLIYSTTGQQIKVWTNIENAALTNATVKIYNSTGSLAYTQRMSSNEMIIDLNLASGLYIVEVGGVKRKVLISPLAP